MRLKKRFAERNKILKFELQKNDWLELFVDKKFLIGNDCYRIAIGG